MIWTVLEMPATVNTAGHSRGQISSRMKNAAGRENLYTGWEEVGNLRGR